MALTDENGIGATMLVQPTGNVGQPYPVYMGQNGGGGNNNGFGDNGWWIVLLIIILVAAGGWGNNNNGGGGAFGGQPIIVNDGNGGAVQRGFDQAAIMSALMGIQGGVQGLSTQLCNCCGDMQMSLANGFAGVEQGANSRAMANMQQLFGLQSQFADCCCENRLATAQTQNIITRESAETRFADANNTRDIIQSQQSGTQAVLDKLCQLELDNYKRENDNLRSQLSDARFAASQIAQTAEIQRGQVAEVDALYDRLQNCPVPSMPVYGRTPIFTCPNQNNNGCGCGCNNGF